MSGDTRDFAGSFRKEHPFRFCCVFVLVVWMVFACVFGIIFSVNSNTKKDVMQTLTAIPTQSSAILVPTATITPIPLPTQTSTAKEVVDPEQQYKNSVMSAYEFMAMSLSEFRDDMGKLTSDRSLMYDENWRNKATMHICLSADRAKSMAEINAPESLLDAQANFAQMATELIAACHDYGMGFTLDDVTTINHGTAHLSAGAVYLKKGMGILGK